MPQPPQKQYQTASHILQGVPLQAQQTVSTTTTILSDKSNKAFCAAAMPADHHHGRLHVTASEAVSPPVPAPGNPLLSKGRAGNQRASFPVTARTKSSRGGGSIAVASHLSRTAASKKEADQDSVSDPPISQGSMSGPALALTSALARGRASSNDISRLPAADSSKTKTGKPQANKFSLSDTPQAKPGKDKEERVAASVITVLQEGKVDDMQVAAAVTPPASLGTEDDEGAAVPVRTCAKSDTTHQSQAAGSVMPSANPGDKDEERVAAQASIDEDSQGRLMGHLSSADKKRQKNRNKKLRGKVKKSLMEAQASGAPDVESTGDIVLEPELALLLNFSGFK